MNVKRFGKGPRMSRGAAYGGILHISGQVAKDRESSIEEQTRQVLAKIDAIVEEAGGSKSGLISVNIFLAHATDFAAMNTVYDAWLDTDHPPARACTESRLADPNLRVEMTATCAVPE